MKKKLRCAAALCSLVMLFTGCSDSDGSDKFNADVIKLTENKKAVKTSYVQPIIYSESNVFFKSKLTYNNPLSTNIFCADPTSVEYNGRLYVYGTNDSQQYEEKPDKENTYEKINSMVILSTDDMVNWRYEGLIETKKIAPWITASWAPSIVSRKEDDGQTHFYLYFSNSGGGVGVITATSPTGPWSDPLGKPLVKIGTPGLNNCPQPFDPGVCIDDNGDGWLAFGGSVGKGGTALYPGTSRIVKLGKDMISLDGEIAKIKAPYFFEASELNYMNGTYVYTYNTSWEKREEWDITDKTKPTQCSMVFMTSKTPLDPKSWEYFGTYFKNPGELGMDYGNNHTHLQKFRDNWYLLFHSQVLQKKLGIKGGFRSICAYPAEVDEKNAMYKTVNATLDGCFQLKAFDPYQVCEAEESFMTDCKYTVEEDLIAARSEDQIIIGLRGVDFGENCSAIAAKVKGKGSIELHLDGPTSPAAAAICVDSNDWTAVYNTCEISGKHDIYFLVSGKVDFDKWQAYK